MFKNRLLNSTSLPQFNPEIPWSIAHEVFRRRREQFKELMRQVPGTKRTMPEDQ